MSLVEVKAIVHTMIEARNHCSNGELKALHDWYQTIEEMGVRPICTGTYTGEFFGVSPYCQGGNHDVCCHLSCRIARLLRDGSSITCWIC